MIRTIVVIALILFATYDVLADAQMLSYRGAGAKGLFLLLLLVVSGPVAFFIGAVTAILARP
jgi:hypothetical protein